MIQVLEHYDLMSRLHQNGDSLTGACPLHGGDSPTAFRVTVSKNCWNCFSKCGGGGNVLDFVARKEEVSLPKAANLLAEWFHLNLPSPGDEKDRPPDRACEPRRGIKPKPPKPAILPRRCRTPQRSKPGQVPRPDFASDNRSGG
jgi:DNA primase